MKKLRFRQNKSLAYPAGNWLLQIFQGLPLPTPFWPMRICLTEPLLHTIPTSLATFLELKQHPWALDHWLCCSLCLECFSPSFLPGFSFIQYHSSSLTPRRLTLRPIHTLITIFFITLGTLLNYFLSLFMYLFLAYPTAPWRQEHTCCFSLCLQFL